MCKEINRRIELLESYILPFHLQIHEPLGAPQLIRLWFKTHKYLNIPCLYYESGEIYSTVTLHQAISRMCRAGLVVRITPGIYEYHDTNISNNSSRAISS